MEEYVKINDIQQYFLHYPTDSDSVVLFLHGGPGASETLLSYAARPTNPVCSFVYYDQRGAGRTQGKNKSKPDTLTLENLLADLRETVKYIKDNYQTEKLFLLGHSWGSVLGTQYVLRYPDDVIAYIGMGQVVHMMKGEERSYKYLGELIHAKGKRKDLKAYEAFAGYTHNLTKDNFMKYAQRFRKLQGKYGLTGNNLKINKIGLKSPTFKLSDIYLALRCPLLNAKLMELLLDYSIEDVTHYDLPVFYICGRNDWQVPSVLVEEYYERIEAPRKQLYWIEDAGHMTNLENPMAYNEAIREIVLSF
ncbi:alpha/beta fold hydrolase [Enterococcus sp. DIV0756]|uniref:alpha/beta fold hydrolase n=1 Tax=Enterococcus sp. DIV0756 TaxID=2774636 RepID=UPI003F2796DD